VNLALASGTEGAAGHHSFVAALAWPLPDSHSARQPSCLVNGGPPPGAAGLGGGHDDLRAGGPTLLRSEPPNHPLMRNPARMNSARRCSGSTNRKMPGLANEIALGRRRIGGDGAHGAGDRPDGPPHQAISVPTAGAYFLLRGAGAGWSGLTGWSGCGVTRGDFEGAARRPRRAQGGARCCAWQQACWQRCC